MPRVRVLEDFRRDLRGHLRTIEQPEWVEGLRRSLADARELLTRFPHAGAIEGEREDQTVRRLVLRTVPFVVWYVYDAKAREVWLVRLFHARQARPNRGG